MKFIRKIRRVFTPKTHCQPIFSNQVMHLKQASAILLDMMRTDDIDQRRRLEKEVKICEVQGDAILTEFFEQLNERFVTVLNRTDLQTVSLNIDEVLDHVNDSAKALLRYLPSRIDPSLIELAEYISAEADALARIFVRFDDMKKGYQDLIQQCDRITELEHAADETYEDYIGYLFSNEKDAIELMKYKNIAEMLEETTDTAKKVSDHIRKLLLRYVVE